MEIADCNIQSTTPAPPTTTTTPEPEHRTELECPFDETFNATQRTEACVGNTHFCCYAISENWSLGLGALITF